MSDTQFHIDALKTRLSVAFWGTRTNDADELASIALQAIGDWLAEPSGLQGLLAGPYTGREKWLRFHFKSKLLDGVDS